MTRKKALVFELDGKGFAFDTGRLFRGVTISEAPDGWNCIIRAYTPKGEPQYAMTKAEQPVEGLRKLYAAVSTGAGEQLWRFDRFAASGG